jgi:uncharacterized protein YwgA
MLEDHAKLISVFKYAGEIVGRKKLQKMVYIAKKLNFPFPEKYEFHFYGPYSEELTLRTEELYNFGFIHEVREKKGGYYQYRYSVTDEGNAFFQQYNMKDMSSLQGCVNSMNEQPPRFLELISTVLFFEDLAKEEVTEKVFTLKQKQRYTEEEIEEAYHYIASLREQQH